VRDQFLVEINDSTAAETAERGMTQAGALLELNALFSAWVESQYHHHVHSETGQTPLARWNQGWQRLGHGPVMPAAHALTEAFRWSEQRTVTKTATVSLHGNTYQVEAALVGHRVELVFSPFDLETIDVHYRGRHYGRAVPFRITRHAHPKARPETNEPPPAPTGIAYLQLVADAHHQQIAADERIGYHALYATDRAATDRAATDRAAASPEDDRQLPGQLCIDDAIDDITTGAGRSRTQEASR
jgi:putative transposase